MRRLTVDDVLAHVQDICFKTGPPGRVGVESEWLVVAPAAPRCHVPIAQVRALLDAAGPPPAGSRLTYEPGGQLELSTPPCPGLAACHRVLAADLGHVTAYLGRHGLALSGTGMDPLRRPRHQLHTPRYACMRAYFAARDEPGSAMMCSTASLQVCVDIGADLAAAARRWWLAQALGPTLVAAFANSPLAGGRLTGWRSTRQAVWAALDPGRTSPPAGDDPVAAWARYALDAQVLLVRDGAGGWVENPGLTFRRWLEDGYGAYGHPTRDDLDYHLSTLFPPVRPRGWLELRMIDALPPAYWPVALAVVAALLDDPVAADVAAEAIEPVAGRWRAAARDALTDPPLAKAARRCFEAAAGALPRLGAEPSLVARVADFTDRYVERGRCPADDVLAPDGRLPAS